MLEWFLRLTKRRLLLLSLVGLTFYTCYTYHPKLISHLETFDLDLVKTNLTATKSIESEVPIIVHWTEFFHHNHISEFIRHFPHCKHKCEHTEDRSLISKARAIVFHARHTNLSDLPPERSDQLRVFFTREGPNQSYFLEGRADDLRADYFNATLTYRTASTMFLPYGYFRTLDGTETEKQKWSQEEIDEKLKKKTKLAVTAVSHCDTWSKRESYLNELHKHMNLTSIGRCSQNMNCKSTECLSRVLDDHFFYFAFENAVCPEYITEKFFHLNELIVPVTLTRAVVPSIFPAESYVAASDFESPKALAEYLQKTASNLTEYRRFFEWTKTHRRVPFEYWHAEEGCQLCEAIYRQHQNVVPDFRRFFDSSICGKGFAKRLVEASDSKEERESLKKEEERLSEITRAEANDRPWYFN
ncbi:Alpha1,3-fucosyltransferase-like proteinue [Aphelenchoides besseyi]|nr:Alpha1,3-fucosyltransferase-like proteinue [Aphelenchoides besseyi]